MNGKYTVLQHFYLCSFWRLFQNVNYISYYYINLRDILWKILIIVQEFHWIKSLLDVFLYFFMLLEKGQFNDQFSFKFFFLWQGRADKRVPLTLTKYWDEKERWYQLWPYLKSLFQHLVLSWKDSVIFQKLDVINLFQTWMDNKKKSILSFPVVFFY